MSLLKRGKKKKAPATPPPGPGEDRLSATALSASTFGTAYQEELFWMGIKRSSSVHAVAAIVAIFMGLVFSHAPVKFTPSIRVDLVALPDLAKKDLSKYKPDDIADLSQKLSEAEQNVKKTREAAKKAPPVPDNTMALKKKPKTKQDELKNAIDRIKALTAIESDVKKSSAPPKVVAKGNALAKGDSLQGEQSTDTNLYVSRLQAKLRENWNLPVWLSQQALNAKVVVFLDKGGYVRHMLISKSSGNTQFDEQALKTIRMAQPFGPPPDEIIDGGITLGFPL